METWNYLKIRDGLYVRRHIPSSANSKQQITCSLGLFFICQSVKNSGEICMEYFRKCNQFADADIVSSGFNLWVNTSGSSEITQLQLCYDMFLSKIGCISQLVKIISNGNIIN